MGEERPEDTVQATLALDDNPPDTGAWLEQLYRQHAAVAFRAAYRVTGDRQDAEDALQTVFLRLAGRSAPPDLGPGAAAYLRRAATNAALDLVTSARARLTTRLEAVPSARAGDSAPGPEAQQRGRELAAGLRAALARLNRRAAEMFALRYFEDLDNNDIARLFQTTPGTVAVTLHRARARLHEELGAHLGGTS